MADFLNLQMTYRLLTSDELQEMEQEFIQFLIANGIDAPEWKKIQEDRKEEVEQWIAAFSDVVIEKALTKINFLEMMTPSEIRLFFCDKEEMKAIFIKSASIDLLATNPQDYVTSPAIEVYKASKKYVGKREEELFQMTQSGCEISDGKLYGALHKVI